MAKTDCVFGHSIESNHSPLGGSLFSVTKSHKIRSENKEKILEIARKIKLPGGEEVEGKNQLLDAYLKHEYPKISSRQQDQAIFMPEYFLSKFPEVVDHDPKNQESSLPPEEIEKLSEPGELGRRNGEKTEKNLYELLQVFFLESNQVTEKKTVVFHSFHTRYQKKPRPLEREADFLIINEEHNMIIYIECKTTGTKDTCLVGIDQLEKMKTFFEEHIPVQDSWTFLKGFFTKKFYPEDAEVIREFKFLRPNTGGDE